MTRWSVFPLLAVVGCSAGVTPPATAPVARPPVAIPAPPDRVWDAVVEWFAAALVPIATIDRPSGLIVAEAQRVRPADGRAWADCGQARDGLGTTTPLVADRGRWNVLVRPAPGGATLRVTIAWSTTYGLASTAPVTQECVSTGQWEREFERAIGTAASGGTP